MKLTAKITLTPDEWHYQSLLKTLEVANAACNAMSEVAWDKTVFKKYSLQQLCYYDVREQFDLTAQVVILLLGLNNHLNELRKRAIKEKNEKLRSDYWWLYFNAKGIESEIREMMLKTENVTLIEMMTHYGLTEIILDDQKDIAPPPEDDEEEEPKPPVDDDDDHSDDIPPRQPRLFDD